LLKCLGSNENSNIWVSIDEPTGKTDIEHVTFERSSWKEKKNLSFSSKKVIENLLRDFSV